MARCYEGFVRHDYIHNPSLLNVPLRLWQAFRYNQTPQETPFRMPDLSIPNANNGLLHAVCRWQPFSVYKPYCRRCGSVGHVPLIVCDQQNDILILDLILFVFANSKKKRCFIITLLFLQNEVESVEYREFRITVNIAQTILRGDLTHPIGGYCLYPKESDFFTNRLETTRQKS